VARGFANLIRAKSNVKNSGACTCILCVSSNDSPMKDLVGTRFRQDDGNQELTRRPNGKPRGCELTPRLENILGAGLTSVESISKPSLIPGILVLPWLM